MNLEPEKRSLTREVLVGGYPRLGQGTFGLMLETTCDGVGYWGRRSCLAGTL